MPSTNSLFDIRVVIHEVRSVGNVASLFRTAEGAGVSHMYLAGITPAPLDRFGRLRKDFSKVSLGSEKIIPYDSVADIEPTLGELKKEGFCVVGLEQGERSVDYRTFEVGEKRKLALVVGNEVLGLPQNILNLCDSVIDIPMRGRKESLNVTVATGIALYKLTEAR